MPDLETTNGRVDSDGHPISLTRIRFGFREMVMIAALIVAMLGGHTALFVRVLLLEQRLGTHSIQDSHQTPAERRAYVRGEMSDYLGRMEDRMKAAEDFAKKGEELSRKMDQLSRDLDDLKGRLGREGRGGR